MLKESSSMPREGKVKGMVCAEALGYIGSLTGASDFILMRPWGAEGAGAELPLYRSGKSRTRLCP